VGRSDVRVGGQPIVGLLIPSVNTVCEPELHALVGDAAHLQSNRVGASADLSDDSVINTLASMDAQLEASARCLASARVRAVAYCCTAGSFYGGGGMQEEVVARLAAAASAPATTTTAASLAALHALGVARVGVVTPYVGVLNERLTALFEGEEVEMLSLETADNADAYANAELSSEQVAELVYRADRAKAEGIYIACTNVWTCHLIADLETELGKPVVTANQATAWHLFELLGLSLVRPLFGRLLAAPRDSRK
jgi:maleate isomerase